MTAQIFRYSVIIATTALALTAQMRAQGGHALFEQALAKERVEGNLPEAIRLYERVVTEFASDRALAARALLQVGQCYEKLGRGEAVKAYERLVRDFADQKEALDQARARLMALKQSSSSGASEVTGGGLRRLQRVDTAGEALSLSPDGTKLAFMNYEKGQNLAVLDIASQRTTQLTNLEWTPDSAWVYDAAWSPDSRRIAYKQCPNRESERACELRAVTLAGDSSVIARNQPEQIRPGGWLPDGSAIVVTLGRPDRTGTVGLMPTDGRPFVPLRSLSGWTGRYVPLSTLSPDGRLIAFVEGLTGDIHVISRDGRTAHRITDHPAADWSPVWSPDGRHLAFLSDRGGMPALWAVALRDGEPAAEPVRIKDGMQDVYPLLGWTTSGLGYSQYQRTDDIHLVPVDPASGEPTGSPRLIPYRRTGHNIFPEWSPDGKYLAFVSSSSAGPTDADRRVVLLPSGGGEPREFQAPIERLWALRWFGDSRGLGITGEDARADRQLFRLTLATGEWKTFPLPQTLRSLQWNGMYIDWNADGSRYFYAWQDAFAATELTIVERDLQSDRERIVYRGKPEDQIDRYRGLRFSPDRRQLSFTSRSGIHILDVQTGQARVLPDDVAGGTRAAGRAAEVPTWSRGAALLINRTENPETEKSTTELRLISADGKGVRRIPLGAEFTRLLSSSRGGPAPTIQSVVLSPDGTRLAIALRASRVDSWIMENPLVLAGAAGASARK